MSMSVARHKLKVELLNEVHWLAGKRWVAPDGVFYPFTDKRGNILCPLMLALNDREVVATDMHELFRWPWSSMATKYQPERTSGTEIATQYARVKAYYRRELVGLVSNEMNTTIADGPEAGKILMWWSACKYGSQEVLVAIAEFIDLCKVKSKPDYGLETMPVQPAHPVVVGGIHERV